MLETALFMVAVAIFPEGLYPNVTLALWSSIAIPNQVILNIFMLSCLNVLDITLMCLEFFYTTFMCSNVEVMSFCKHYNKMAFAHTNLSILSLTASKKKRCPKIQSR